MDNMWWGKKKVVLDFDIISAIPFLMNQRWSGGGGGLALDLSPDFFSVSVSHVRLTGICD